MRALRGDNLLLAIVLALLVLVLGAYAALFGRPNEPQKNLYDIGSDRGNGLKTFVIWLREQGYVAEDVIDVTRGLKDLDLLLVFPGERSFDKTEIKALLDWVERYNAVLVLSLSERSFADFDPDDTLGSALDDQEAALLKAIGVRRLPGFSPRPLTLTQPVITDRPSEAAPLVANPILISDAPDSVVLAGTQNGAQIIAIKRAGGMIVVSTASDLFTNSTLRNRERGDMAIRIVNGMLSHLTAGARVGIDQSRLSARAIDPLNDPRSKGALLRKIYSTPWGWAILSALAICMGALAINGRRFGRATPLARELVRRSPAEYIQSMAGLYRRANQRERMLDHYRRQIKRRLGSPYGVSADFEDAQFAEELKKMRADLDERALLNTLRSLSHARNQTISEGELVKRVNAAQEIIRQQQESWKA